MIRDNLKMITNTFGFGCSEDGASNVVIEDVVLGVTPTLIWYEGVGSYRVRKVDNPYALVVEGDTLKVDWNYNGNVLPENYAENIVVIDASANSSNITIAGNAQSNSVISGSGITNL